MYKIINDILTIFVGLMFFLYGVLVIYRICKKRYGKDSIILVGKIIAFRVGDGLKKTYIPIIEVTYNDVISRYMAIDNLSFKEKYSLHANIELYYNKSLRKNPILIKNDYGIPNNNMKRDIDYGFGIFFENNKLFIRCVDVLPLQYDDIY